MDVTLASELIAAQFPELSPVRVACLGEGCDSTAFDVNGRWVFRFPRRRDVEAQLRIERRLLPLLAERLPVPVPRFRFHGQPSPEFGHEFCGYPRLPGVPAIGLPANLASFNAIAGTLGRFLAALHAIPVEQIGATGVPEARIEDTIAESQADAIGDLTAVAGVASDAPLDRWRRFLEAGPAADHPSSKPTLVHNDFAAEHVLVSPDAQAVTGVIDWSDAAISAAEVDFAGLFHWGGEPLARAVLARYSGPLADAAMNRARYLGACRGAMDVAFGVEVRRPEYVAAGLHALRLCAGG